MNLQNYNYIIDLNIKAFLFLGLSLFFLNSCQDSLDSISPGSTEESPKPIAASSTAKPALTIEVSKKTGYEFKVLDATGFVGKPDMSKYGIRPMPTLRSKDFWEQRRNKKNQWDFVPEDKAAEVAQKAKDRYKSRTVMLRLGHWPINADDEVLRHTKSHYSRLYHDLNRSVTKTDYGIFNIPKRGWWTNDPAPRYRKRFHEKNDRFKNIAKKVDALFLKGYAISKDQTRWERNVKILIEEAKRIGDDQPIYLVLWPQYWHARDKNLKNQYIGRPFWQRMLDTAKKHADGVVLYTPPNTKWNTNAAWWNTTKRFMEELGEYSSTPKVSNSQFKVFDGTRYRNETNMDRLGYTPFEIVYAGRIWDKPLSKRGKWELPSQSLVKKWARGAYKENNNITMLNIEHWPTKGTDEEVQKSVDSYITVHDWFKREQPGMKIGYFNTVPRKFHWKKYPQKNWIQTAKERVEQLRPLADKVDVFFPQGYTYNEDKKGWLINTKYMLKHVNEYGGNKPVYLVLWPQYYERVNSKLRGRYMDREFWRLQLETARRYADGIVIWLPKSAEWSEASSAPWWNETQMFLKELGKAS
jgi:hypothetical protein